MKVAFIGAGGHARTSLYPNLVAAGLDLVAVATRHLDHSESVARQFGCGRAYDDVDALLTEGGFDAVLIAVPAGGYRDLIGRCLGAGYPVFAEKPGAASAAEAHELAAIARAAGKPVQVGYMKRFAPAYRIAREIIGGDEFGTPTVASFTFAMGPWGNDLRHYLIDNPVHVLDLARFLLGEVHDLRGHVGSGKSGHALAVTGRADSGAVLTMNLCTGASWVQHNESVEVFGAGHSVLVDNVDTVVHRLPERPEHRWRPNYTVPLGFNFTGTTLGFVPELEHFRLCVTEGASCESDLDSAARTLELAEELCRWAEVQQG